MKRTPNKLVFIYLLFTTHLTFAMTLQEAIKVSLENNPKTVANQLRVKAMEDRVQAQRLSWYPKIYLNAGYDISESRQSSEAFSVNSQSKSARVGIGSAITLYDGGSNSYSQKAAEADLKAMQARYSSSNALIPNTRGSIARAVKNAYVNLLEIAERKNYLRRLESTLHLFMTAANTDDEKTLVQQRINDLKSSMAEVEASQSAALNDFKYFATVPAPLVMQPLEDVIASLNIPANADEAFRIALEKSPNIKLASYELESAQYKYKSEKADLYSPRVTLNASVQRGSNINDESSSQGTSASIGINIRYTLDPSAGSRNRATQKTVEASQRDKEGAIEETKFEIDSIYPYLMNQQQIYLLQLESLRSAEESLNQLINKIKNGQKVDIKFGITNVLDPHKQYVMICLQQKIEILNVRFNIQRSVGILFDSVELISTKEGFAK